MNLSASVSLLIRCWPAHPYALLPVSLALGAGDVWKSVVWGAVGLCILVGLLGTLLPILPGTALILLGACGYEWFLAEPAHKLGWLTLGGLAGLVVASYLVDFFLVAAGARHFGASKYGPLGAIGGLIVGLFLGLPGILLGPPCGVVVVELISGKDFPAALRASWGTVVGSVSAGFVRAGIGLAMVVWFVWAVRSA